MPIIKTKKLGVEIIVDDEWYEMLSAVSWGVVSNKKPGGKKISYAVFSITKNGKQIKDQMHRVITDAPKNKQVDHINGNTLDNRFCNLRICDQSENKRNRIGWYKKTSSKHKGVCWDKARGKWLAKIRLNHKQINLGRFKTEKEAAMVYNEAALKYHGEFARLNVLD